MEKEDVFVTRIVWFTIGFILGVTTFYVAFL